MDSKLFNQETMWQLTVTFEKGLSDSQKEQNLKQAANSMSSKSPIVDLFFGKKKGCVVFYRPDCVPVPEQSINEFNNLKV